MKRKTVEYGSNAILFTAITLACIIGINLLVVKNEKKIDMTVGNIFSLAPQTIKVLKSLEYNITVYAYIRPEQGRETADLLGLYKYESGKFSYQIIDPDKKPALAKRHNVTKYGTFVVKADNGKWEAIQKLGENEITNAILKVVSGETKVIYVLEGHGERILTDTNPRGWSGVKDVLTQAGYEVKVLNWFETGKIPEDADLLIVAGPRNDYTEKEIELLRARFKSRGSVLFTMDPAQTPNLMAFLKEWGITLNDDMVLDTVSEKLGFGPLVAAMATYTNHPVVKDIKAASFYPVSRSLTLDTSNDKIEVLAIGQTAAQSWGETDLVSIEKGAPKYDEGRDFAGPRIIAATAEWEVGKTSEKLKIGEAPKRARIVVVGDSDFASNATLGLSSNRDVFLNMIGWLAFDEARISIRPNKAGFHPLVFTSDQLKAIFWPVVVILPLIVAVAGFIVSKRRRRI